MRKIVYNFVLVAALAFAGSYTLTSCGSKTHEEAHEEGAAHDHEASDSVDEMDKTEHTKDGEEMAYACPMHPEEKGKEGDKCSKCKMALEKVETEIEE